MWKSVCVVAIALLVAPPLHGQQFGAYAATGNGEILISEPVKPNEPATVYVYRLEGGEWSQAGTLTAPAHEGGDYFGRFIVHDDESLIVGGTLLDQSTGAVWTYRRNGTEWESTGMLRPSDLAGGDAFGRFGLLRGDLLFVSGLGHNESRGACLLYTSDAADE